MKTIKIPYGRTHLEAELPDNNLVGIYESDLPSATCSGADAVTMALDAPVSSPPLEELARGRKSAVLIISDHTRPVPSHIITPLILERLRRGSPEIDITILVATGFHRGTTHKELIEKLGEDIVRNEKIVVHDSRDESSLTSLGKLPSGGELIVNRLAVEAELLVAEGFIEPHFFAGFSGGRKSVLPGIASTKTVLANHCAEFIQNPHARAGILENNPIHRDMIAGKGGKARVGGVAKAGGPERQDLPVADAGLLEEIDESEGLRPEDADSLVAGKGSRVQEHPGRTLLQPRKRFVRTHLEFNEGRWRLAY